VKTNKILLHWGSFLLDWYAIFVETGEEDIVQKYIQRFFQEEQIKTLVPRRKLIERKGGKTYERIRHLIPGYVLAQAQMDTRLYYQLKSIPAVYSVLKSEYDPVPIRQEEMELILTLTRQGETIDFSQVYKEGERIRVISGPLKGLEGIIEKYDHRKKRVKICLEFLGQPKRIDLGAYTIDNININNPIYKL